MKSSLLKWLCCPRCCADLRIAAADGVATSLDQGSLGCLGCRGEYPIVDGIPRFVSSDNYSTSFGFQWNRFRRTQLDSQSGLPISRDRFFAQSGWTPEELRGSRVLDVGCGAGRFAEVALSCGAQVVALDYSQAVDACRANLEGVEALEVVQGDIYHLPFRKGRFDFVYCFGVLQHTPDVDAAFRALPEQVKPGGRLAVDVYPRLAVNALLPRYWLRPLTRRIPPERLFPIVERALRFLYPLSTLLARTPLVGRKLRHLLPVANYAGVFPLSEAQLREWSLLDTFDMLSPAHDHPRSAGEVRRWFEAAGFEAIEVLRPGHLVGRGRRPRG